MVVLGTSLNHRHSESHCFYFTWSPKAKSISAIFTHFVRSSLLVLIPQLHAKVCFIRSFRKISHIETMLFFHILSTNVAEYIWIIDTTPTWDVEAVIFQSLPLPHLSLLLPLSKNDKTTVDLSKFVIYYSQKV